MSNAAKALKAARYNAATLDALRGSIAKWEAIVDGTGEDNGWKNCPLCLLFNNRSGEITNKYCRGCPVADAGHTRCDHTPYADFVEAEDACDTEARAQAAKDEGRFLRGLLAKVELAS